jgi:hypothetical protein
MSRLKIMHKINTLLTENEKILEDIASMLSDMDEHKATKTERRIMYKLLREGYGELKAEDGRFFYSYPF